MINYFLYGLGFKFKNILKNRLELTTYLTYYHSIFYLNTYFTNFDKKFIKVINIILSQVSSVNSSLKDLKKLNIIRKYLIKSYSGYCHAIGKPVRGQRT
jgi:ribosomal protein S13